MTKKQTSHKLTLIALLFAILAGLFTNKNTVLLGVNVYGLYDFIGTIFLNGLKMLSVPLIVTSIISGIVSIGTEKNIGKMGIKTMLYYLTTCILAVLVGIVLINIFEPGYDPHLLTEQDQAIKEKMAVLFSNVEAANTNYFYNIFYKLVPSNIFYAASNGDLLGLIMFSLFFGYFTLHLESTQKEVLTNFWNASFGVIMLFTMWFLRFTPIGVFGLVAKSVAETGASTFLPVIKFFFTVLLALGIHTFIILSLLLYYYGKINPWLHFKTMLPVLLTAFSTSSSSASLPMAMECVEKDAGVSNKTSSFVLPLGTAINMNGTALYEGMAAIFIAQTYGINLGLDKQLLVLVIALVTSVGVAGIPSASLVAIPIILTAIGIPMEAIGIIMVTDRVLDMFRTAVNVYSDTCGAVIIASRSGEDNLHVRRRSINKKIEC